MAKMIELTKKEQEALLILYKDFTFFHNSNSMSKVLGVSQVGAMKILKRLEKSGILKSKRIGKSVTYKINLKEEIARKLIGFALINEARKYERWEREFELFYKKWRIVLFYGSASRDYEHARDIDVMIIHPKKDFKEVYNGIIDKQKILPKKLHAIQATKEDLLRNLKDKNKAMVEIIRTAIVLHGYDDYIGIINGFATF